MQEGRKEAIKKLYGAYHLIFETFLLTEKIIIFPNQEEYRIKLVSIFEELMDYIEEVGNIDGISFVNSEELLDDRLIKEYISKENKVEVEVKIPTTTVTAVPNNRRKKLNNKIDKLGLG